MMPRMVPVAVARACCATCTWLDGTGFDRTGRDGGAGPHSCRLRAVAIAAPALSACANHPDHGAVPRPLPIGPVVQYGEGGAELLHASPDSRAVRELLLRLAETIEVRGEQPLSFRDVCVLEQLRAFGEPRAFVHLDRIDAALAINRARGARPSALGRFAAVLEQHAPSGSRAPEQFLLRFSLAGRLLLLSAVACGAAAFAVLLWLEAALWRATGHSWSWLHVSLDGGLAVVVALLWLRVGLWLFRRAGIAFNANDADATGGGR